MKIKQATLKLKLRIRNTAKAILQAVLPDTFILEVAFKILSEHNSRKPSDKDYELKAHILKVVEASQNLYEVFK